MSIFYSNSDVQEEHLMFIGRWCPLHEGHTWIIEEKMKETDLPVLILVRSTKYDEIHVEVRSQLIVLWMKEKNIKGTVLIIPDIKGIYYGRGVGYDVEEMIPTKEIKQISATQIREMIKNKDDSWKDLVAQGTQDYIEYIYDSIDT